MKRAKRIFTLIILAVILSISCIMMGACDNSGVVVRRKNVYCFEYKGIKYESREDMTFNYDVCQKGGKNEIGYAENKFGNKIPVYFMESDVDQNVLIFKYGSINNGSWYVKEGFELPDIFNTPICEYYLERGAMEKVEVSGLTFNDIIEQCKDEYSVGSSNVTWIYLSSESYPYLYLKLLMFKRDNDVFIKHVAGSDKRYYKIVDETYREIFFESLS